MPGRMIEFDAGGALAPGYLATPDAGVGPETPGVVVLHAWWGLTEPFRQVCDRLAEAGFVALAPDLYRGKTTAVIAEADALSDALYQERERVGRDIAGATRFLRHYGQDDAASVAGILADQQRVGVTLGDAGQRRGVGRVADHLHQQPHGRVGRQPRAPARQRISGARVSNATQRHKQQRAPQLLDQPVGELRRVSGRLERSPAKQITRHTLHLPRQCLTAI